ncbi:MAG: hypothetical protein QF441_05100 [Bacteriovoracaceae bacterium]|jgi:hypothetical protein|nr:hypothetical protein [Bacteriovoracaceae bacterium]
MNYKKINYALVFIFLFCQNGLAEVFTFEKGISNWGVWGSGLGSLVKDRGHQDKSSLWMSCDFGQEKTLYRKFDNLKNGRYKIEFYLRSLDGADKNIWSFFDRGQGTETIFRKSFEDGFWTKVTYHVEINSKSFEFWLRLTSSGQVWFDSFKLSQVKQSLEKKQQGVVFQKITPKIKMQPTLRPTPHLCVREGLFWDRHYEKCPHCGGPFAKNEGFKEEKKELFTRDHKVNLSPLRLSKTKKHAVIKSRDYYHLKKSSLKKISWNKYNFLKLSFLNPHKKHIELSVAIADTISRGYWGQLNHNTILAPGKNTIYIPLKQKVGERGSVRYDRTIDYNKIAKVFLVTDVNEKLSREYNVLLESIHLIYSDYPKRPMDIFAFDFTGQKANLINGFIPITTKNKLNTNRVFGFVEPDFYRVFDDKYTDPLNRYSIGVRKGSFEVKLPNGNYQYTLQINRLGYWDIPFWKSREVVVNGKVRLSEHRTTDDFLKDYFRFENHQVSLKKNIYDYYLGSLFERLEGEVQVSNGKLSFDFKGDATGINLNSLVIWEKSKEKNAKKFLEKVDRAGREFFRRNFRAIDFKNQKTAKLGVVKPRLDLNPNGARSIKKKIDLRGGVQTQPFSLIQIPKKDVQKKITVSDLKSAQNEVIQSSEIEVSQLIYQFASADANHETYQIVGKYLKPLKNNKLQVDGAQNSYLSLKVKINQSFSPGEYKGTLRIGDNSLPILLKVDNYELPSLNFPVGMIGLDPLPYLYFDSKQLVHFSHRLRMKALELLISRGFTTFSGLPGPTNISSNDFHLPSELTEVLSEAKKNSIDTIFSYGGQFLADLEIDNKDSNFTDFYKKVFKMNQWPKFVLTVSDEAAGYSNRVKKDILYIKKLKKHYSSLLVGGFSHTDDFKTESLNRLFDYGIYSSLSYSSLKNLKKIGQKVGMYNLSSGALEDPRYVFGPWLYRAQQAGLDFYLDWHLSAFQNYPYYDLDGREGDIAMLYPTRNGELYPSLKFELATEGLELFRKISFLDTALKQKLGSQKALIKIKKWLKTLRQGDVFKQKQLTSAERIEQFYVIKDQADELLGELY